MSSSKARFLSILAKDITTVGKVPSTNIVLPASGVTAATYGSATQIPVLTIDTEGRVTISFYNVSRWCFFFWL